MKQTMLLQLAPTPEQHHARLETMHVFNEAASYIASVAFAEKTANSFALHQLVYGQLRTTCKLPAHLAIRCISKVRDAAKRAQRIKPTCKPEGAMAYDERVMAFKGLTHVWLLTLRGRGMVPFLIGPYQAARMERITGQADLLIRRGTFYLAVTLDVPPPDQAATTRTPGVDLGIHG